MGNRSIHAVGPDYDEHEPQEAKRLLVGAYRGAMNLVKGKKMPTVAFPVLSSGVYGYPVGAAVTVAVKTLREFKDLPVTVYIVAFDDAMYKRLTRALAR